MKMFSTYSVKIKHYNHIFKDKKQATILGIELLAPWLVLVFGIPTIILFGHSSDYEIYGRLSLITTCVVISMEFLIGLISFVKIFLALREKNQNRCLENLVLWLGSGACIVGCWLLMLLVIGLSAGQGV